MARAGCRNTIVVLDKDGNIDSGRELFGDNTIKRINLRPTFFLFLVIKN
jgi:hypothetical protein